MEESREVKLRDCGLNVAPAELFSPIVKPFDMLEVKQGFCEIEYACVDSFPFESVSEVHAEKSWGPGQTAILQDVFFAPLLAQKVTNYRQGQREPQSARLLMDLAGEPVHCCLQVRHSNSRRSIRAHMRPS